MSVAGGKPWTFVIIEKELRINTKLFHKTYMPKSNAFFLPLLTGSKSKSISSPPDFHEPRKSLEKSSSIFKQMAYKRNRILDLFVSAPE